MWNYGLNQGLIENYSGLGTFLVKHTH